MDRRFFIKSSLGIIAYANILGCESFLKEKSELFNISLAEWSLHNTIFNEKLQNLDFPVIARQKFGIGAVEYVNQFFMSKARDEKYLKELNNRAAQEGVKNLLIMIDNEGSLGTLDQKTRKVAIENHYKWIDCAAVLGCHSIRVNTYGDGSEEEQLKNSADSLHKLAEYGDKMKINVIVENHGGFSSDSRWLTKVMKAADHPRVGTLPDFGNFPEDADIYKEVKNLMPYAKGVSAKSSKFDEEGNEVRIDYEKMLKIVLDSGYRGYVGIEFSGPIEHEEKGIMKTKNLLERVRKELSKSYS